LPAVEGGVPPPGLCGEILRRFPPGEDARLHGRQGAGRYGPYILLALVAAGSGS